MGKYSTPWNLMTEFHCSLSFMLQISKIGPKLSLRDCNIPSFRWVNKIDQYELDESENDATKKGKRYLIDMVVKNYKMREQRMRQNYQTCFWKVAYPWYLTSTKNIAFTIWGNIDTFIHVFQYVYYKSIGVRCKKWSITARHLHLVEIWKHGKIKESKSREILAKEIANVNNLLSIQEQLSVWTTWEWTEV